MTVRRAHGAESKERKAKEKVMRKNLMLCAVLVALCGSAEAQQPKVYRVGVLVPGTHGTR